MKIPTQLTPSAKAPTRKTPGAAGFDLCSLIAVEIGEGERAIIPTGVRVAIPSGHYLRIAPRSGLAAKFGIDVLAGVIDSDYRGEIGVVLINHGASAFRVNPGDAIAQGIIERCYDATFDVFEELPPTERGEKGWGSTGK